MGYGSSAGEVSQATIHGGYETKDRINYLLWQSGKARLTGDGKILLQFLSQLYLEVVGICRGKNSKEEMKTLLNSAVTEYNQLVQDNRNNKKNLMMSPELYDKLFKLDEKLREKAAPHIMPSRSDPGVAISEY